MTNEKEQNLRKVRNFFPPKFSAVKFSAAPTARLAGEKRGVLFAVPHAAGGGVVPRAAGGVDTSQGESRGWGR